MSVLLGFCIRFASLFSTVVAHKWGKRRGVGCRTTRVESLSVRLAHRASKRRVYAESGLLVYFLHVIVGLRKGVRQSSSECLLRFQCRRCCRIEVHHHDSGDSNNGAIRYSFSPLFFSFSHVLNSFLL